MRNLACLMGSVVENHKTDLSVSAQQISDRGIVSFSCRRTIGQFFMRNRLSVFTGKDICTAFFQHSVAQILPVAVLQTVIVERLLIIVQVNGEMMLFLHLL